MCMCMCMSICMCMCISGCIYVYVYVYVCAHVRAYVYVYMYMYLYAYLYSYLYLYMFMYVYEYCVHAWTLPRVKQAHACKTGWKPYHICIQICTCSHTHAATHKNPSDVRPWNTPSGSIVIWLLWRSLLSSGTCISIFVSLCVYTVGTIYAVLPRAHTSSADGVRPW